MRVHKLGFAALTVAAGLSLTACQNGGGQAQGSPPSAQVASTAPSVPAASVTPTEPAGPTPGGSADRGGSGQGGATGSKGTGTSAGTDSTSTGKIGECRTDELEITAADRGIGRHDYATVVVELKNRGGRDCVISGYPGVDLKTTSGQLSAMRTGEQVVPGILRTGKSTFFGIYYPGNASGSGIRVTALIVTPPDETKAVTLDWPGVGPLRVTEGMDSPVKVGVIGGSVD
ncbi:DUF4232 domain-containing protein [Kitasatospora sp. NPDC058406]|uniref:DUF4232 domain-containing protein n=1 Tax=Kitasatospora sp. NPDC058406 TaxID=3346483 RepID=UPI00366A0B9D